MLDIANKQHDGYQAAIEQWNVGAGYALKGFNETALNYYLEGLAYLEKGDYQEDTRQMYKLIQALYGRMDRHEEALEYGYKSLAMINDTLSLVYGEVLINLSANYYSISPPQYEKAMEGLQKTLRIAKLKGNIRLESRVYLTMANIYSRTNRVDECEKYNLKALEFFTESKSPTEFCIATIGLAKVAFFRNDFKKAEALIEKDLEVIHRHGIRQEEKNAYLFLWELSAAKHDYIGRNRWRTAADSVQNLIANEKILNAAKELEIKYETEKKEIRITDLEKEKVLYRWLGLAAAVLVLLVFGLLFARHKINVHKQRLSEQKVKQLEQEKQLIATQSVLDGETQERTRLARDLHDGLGSLLTAVKLNLGGLNQGAIMNNDDVVQFHKALDLLDESMGELRRVAHHLMPESLSRCGLKVALSDFCDNIPTVTFSWYGNETRLDSNLEVMIYRVVQELVNNALKHSDASHILVQIIQEEDRIAFTVQDDGKGFDPALATEGMGIQNTRDRIKSFGGTMDIVSAIGEGTEINAELRIEN
jgi:signal transduction histidine kinase